MTKQLEALKPQAFELLIANGYEMANQLRHLANNEIDSDSFAVVTENYNGIETEFERSITELALQAAGTFDALIAALEQVQQRVDDEICRANREHHRGFMMACKHLEAHANVHYADAAEVEIAALGNRIAELEASPLAVKLHKRSVGEVMHMSGFGRDYAEGWCAGNDNAIHEILAAGGTVSEGE